MSWRWAIRMPGELMTQHVEADALEAGLAAVNLQPAVRDVALVGAAPDLRREHDVLRPGSRRRQSVLAQVRSDVGQALRAKARGVPRCEAQARPVTLVGMREHPVRLQLEIDARSELIRGTLGDDQGDRRPFEGWMELAAVLQAFCDGDPPRDDVARPHGLN